MTPEKQHAPVEEGTTATGHDGHDPDGGNAGVSITTIPAPPASPPVQNGHDGELPYVRNQRMREQMHASLRPVLSAAKQAEALGRLWAAVNGYRPGMTPRRRASPSRPRAPSLLSNPLSLRRRR